MMTNIEQNNAPGSKPGVPRWAWVFLVLVLAVGVFLIRPAANSNSSANQEVASDSTLPRLVDLGADKCVPCKMMAPILKELKTEYAGKFDVEFIDVWKNPDAGDGYNIKIIPTQVFFADDGTELFRHEGFFAKEDILAKWRELGTEI